MKRLLVFQHVPYEILGILDPMLRSAGFRIRYMNFGRDPQATPTVERYDGLIVLGGPMNCDQVDSYPHLATEVAAIREALDRGIPILGICLGSQLLARALGAEVTRNPVKEIGWYDVSPTSEAADDPLFRALEGTEKIFQWHGDTFALPDGAVHLATSEACANQAFRFGDNAYGLQFHLEVDTPLIERWIHTPVHIEEMQGLPADHPCHRIHAETPEHIGRSRDLAVKVFGAFIDVMGAAKTSRALPSR